MPAIPALPSPNTTIAHYRIVSRRGEGSMGEVYRAIDTRLNPDVAIKMLPPAYAVAALSLDENAWPYKSRAIPGGIGKGDPAAG